MKRLAVMFGCLMFFASPALAISEFGKQWKAEYLGDDASDDFKRSAARQVATPVTSKAKTRKRSVTSTAALCTNS